MIVKSDGAIYFTDPTYGRMPGFGIEREQELDFQGVYRIPPGGGDPSSWSTTSRSPTACASPPTRRCSTSTTPTRAHIRVFDVGDDGTLSNGRVLAEGSAPATLEVGDLVDGMKVDERGNVWVTGPGGVWVFDPDGEHLGTLEVPESVGTSTGAVRTGTGCSSPPPPRCTASSARSPATASPT